MSHDFLRLRQKRNKSATLRLLDVLVTQHAKWTARRIRRALFGQSLLDFSGSSWSCVKIHKSAPEPTQVNRRKAKVSRIMREFSEVTQESSQSVVETDKKATTSSSKRRVPGMSQYDEGVDMHDNQDIFSDNHDVDMDVGTEDSQEAGQDPAAISKKCEFFVLSPR